LESARPAIRKGKAVMDAARNNFPNNGIIQANLNNVYDNIYDEDVQYYRCGVMSEMVNLESDFVYANMQRKADEVAQAQPRKKTAEEGAQGEEEAMKVLREAVWKEDIDVILAVMAQHRDSTEVQQKGCGVLGSVARNNPATHPTIAEKGGIEAVFHAMTQHSHHEDVQQEGCRVMYFMVSLKSARPAIRKGKAVMDAARNNFPNHGGIKTWLNYVYLNI
jgi:hypothetical protein